MAGETNLTQLIRGMKPVLNSGEYVFTTVTDLSPISRADTICEFQEQEGTTVVMAKDKADGYGLAYEYVAAWITLEIHSALDAVGLTAAIATELARHGMSCNVIAGYFHDHLFVDLADGKRAIEVLQTLAETYTERK